MNKRPRRGAVDLIFLTAQRVQMPPGHMISVILITAEHDRIARASQTQMDMSLALLVAHQQAKNELSPLELELGKAPLPS